MRLIIALLTLSLSGISTFAKPAPSDEPSRPMTVRQARAALEESLTQLLETTSVKVVKFTRPMVTFTANGKNGSIVFADIKRLSVTHIRTMASPAWYMVRNDRKPLALFSAGPARFKSEAAATMFVDAVLNLKKAALGPDPTEDEFSDFVTGAQGWLTQTPKPEMRDEARAYKILAEDAFKRKNLPAALDAYGKALDRHPMWPEGHYNAALLAAETEDYELAAYHMRRYLVLAPDAQDAAASKDKLLLWQLRSKE